jgi:UDPglucose 6-dehydrogenase
MGESTGKVDVAVIGHTGMVGSQVYKWFTSLGIPAAGYSLDAPEWDWHNARFVFVCVPTPRDASIVREVIERIEGGTTVVIKSTVPPGTTEAIAKERDDLRMMFNPEFLSIRTAWGDFARPERQVIGYTDFSKGAVSELLALLPPANRDVILPATGAEILKYVHNMHGAMQVTFANMVYDMCQAAGVDYAEVRVGAPSEYLSPETVARYWNVNDGGKRGYAGPCFPKDMDTLWKWCDENGVGCELLDGMTAYNERLLGAQGLDWRGEPMAKQEPCCSCGCGCKTR